MDMIWRRLKISGNERVLPMAPKYVASRDVCFCFSVSRPVINNFSRYAAGNDSPPEQGNNTFHQQRGSPGPRSLETRDNPTGGDIESAIWTFDASTQHFCAIWTNSDFCTFSIRFIGVTNSLTYVIPAKSQITLHYDTCDPPGLKLVTDNNGFSFSHPEAFEIVRGALSLYDEFVNSDIHSSGNRPCISSLNVAEGTDASVGLCAMISSSCWTCHVASYAYGTLLWTLCLMLLAARPSFDFFNCSCTCAVLYYSSRANEHCHFVGGMNLFFYSQRVAPSV